MGQIAITSRIERIFRLSKREQLIVLEIGTDSIDSASSFVNYISESYGFSKSSVWYNLNRLKEKKMLDFATKDEPGKFLVLTKVGAAELRTLERSGVRLGVLDGSVPSLLPNDGPVIAPNLVSKIISAARVRPGGL